MASKTPDNRAEGARKRSIRADVLNELAEAHADEFHARMSLHYEEEGIIYVRPLTDEEKAAATVAELVEKYPSLAGKVAPVVAVDARHPADIPDDSEDVAIAADLGIDPALKRG